jgi:hypothetical protein
MRRQFMFTLVILAGATAVAARAQDMRPRTTEPRSFIYSMGPEDFRVERRGRLGITVDLRPDAGRDSVGARVASVTPGGPADHAGVQTGDIITRLNGSRLVGDTPRGNDDENDDERSRPGMRLINLASRLEPGDTVRLDVKRENRTLSLTFQADRTEMDNLVERMREPGGGMSMMREFAPMMNMRTPGGAGGNMRIMVRTDGLGDLELVTVTPQLAQGLGISEGVLVVSIDSANTLGLQAGDVISSIAGRRPTSPAHAMRILGSYDPGESVAFDVMRHGRRSTVNGRVPERRNLPWRVTPNSYEFTLPVMPREPMHRLMEELHQLPKLLGGEGKV